MLKSGLSFLEECRNQAEVAPDTIRSISQFQRSGNGATLTSIHSTGNGVG